MGIGAVFRQSVTVRAPILRGDSLPPRIFYPYFPVNVLATSASSKSVRQ